MEKDPTLHVSWSPASRHIPRQRRPASTPPTPPLARPRSSAGKPRVSPVDEDGWVALETFIPEKTVRDSLPELRRAGAQGLVEYPLNKVIY